MLSGIGKLYKMFVVLLMLVIILLSGCGQTEISTSNSEFPMTFIDDLDRKVTINKVPQRIVSLAPANTENLFSLGLGDKIVGVTRFCNYPPEAKEKPVIGGFSKPNAELVVAANPDLVVATNRHKEFINQLESSGIKVISIEGYELTKILDNIKLIGKITGKSKKAEELVSDMQKRIDRVVVKVKNLSQEEKPSVYFEIWPDPLTTGGAKSLLNNLIETAGGKNIVGDVEKDWVTLNPEVLLAENPKVVIISHHGASKKTLSQVKAREGWKRIEAIKNNRVYYIEDKDIVHLAGPRIVDGLEVVAKCIHPKLFE
ncbi:MAG: cobalamin-binding protein [Clostridiales bacterium]|nr:cobalamin-binding protein [Clostridiales bacterium]MCF8021838.1 cobalamin-binding protein [Clostridiales bacterium]